MEAAMVRSRHAIRQQGAARRRAITPSEHAAWSAAIAARVVQHPAFQSAQRIALYANYGDEVRTDEVCRLALAAGKQVFYPRVDPQRSTLWFYPLTNLRDLQPGYRGIREPAVVTEALVASHFDLIIMPGVAFDTTGHRVGRGGGYYDRWLPTVTAPRLALAYECQLFPAVPVAAHDQMVDDIVTERRVIHCAEERL